MKKLLGSIFIWLAFSFQVGYAYTSYQVFARYPNKYFIETGSFVGSGIDNALAAGFQHIYSIELAPDKYEYCRAKFRAWPNVKLVLGDSSTKLAEVLQEIDAPATFWLDGHYSGDNTAKGETNTPILAELDAIAAHSIKTHTILIDDIRQLGQPEFDYIKLDQLEKKILAINPNYQIHFDEGIIPNDVLVAEIPK